MEHGFTLFQLLPYGDLYGHVIAAGLAALLLILFAVRARSAQMAAGDALIIPEENLTTRNLADLLVGALDGFVGDVMGHEGRKFTPLFGAMFLFILLNNAMGLIPGWKPATDNISTNFGIAIVVFLLTHIIGFKVHGIGYFKHFLGPVMLLAPLMLPIELISHLVRPVSLSIRLFGNMFGDHMVLGIFTGLTKLFVPVIFYGLGLFVCFIQAFVFTMLSMIYISLASSHDH